MAYKSPIFRLRRGVLAAGLCLAVSACDNPWLEDAPSLETVLSKGWLFGEKEDVAPPRIVQPLYCYETIGVGDCYDQPIENGGNRLVGFEGPAPETGPLPDKP
jgi:hypothetical protein